MTTNPINNLPPRAPVSAPSSHHVRNKSTDSKSSKKSIFDINISDHLSPPSPSSNDDNFPQVKIPNIALSRNTSIQTSPSTAKKTTINPFEVEAEHGILHAIEQTEKILAHEADSIELPSHSRLLSGIPMSSALQQNQVFSLNQNSDVASPEDDSTNISLSANGINGNRDRAKTFGSVESGAPSVLYNDSSRTGRDKQNIDVLKPTQVSEVEHRPTPKPTLEEVTDRMRLLTEMSRQKSTHNLESSSGYTKIQTEESPTISGDIDPELGGHHESSQGQKSHIAPTGRNSNISNILLVIRCLFAPLFVLRNIIKVRGGDIKYYAQLYICFITPTLAISALLFYVLGNPEGPHGASWSWWLNFLVRQAVSLLLAHITQFILIDFIVLETRVAVWALGKLLTLLAIQSKGWPLLAVFWATWNFAFNHGNTGYAKHWLYWQSTIGMFNERNPSGDVVTDPKYRVILLVMIFMGMIFMIKRIVVALILGKKKYVTYGPKLESIMRKLLLIAEVAILAEEIQFAATHDSSLLPSSSIAPASGWLFSGYEATEKFDEDDDDLTDTSPPTQRKNSDLYEIDDMSIAHPDEAIYTTHEENNSKPKSDGKSSMMKKLKWNPFMKASVKPQSQEVQSLLRSNEKIVVGKLLGEWEIPEVARKETWRDASISKILQFREGINYMSSTHPLSVPFGIADTRQNCARSAEIVYNRLLMKNSDPVLHIETLLILAIDKEGKLDKNKARALIKLFRPDRNGNITLLDFLQSCDAVYKRVVLFRATLTNAVLASSAGINPSELFLSIGAVFLPLSFLFSSAASKFFEGLLLVLVRQPYDIGDRIALSDPSESTSIDGSTTWYVENITLFQTTVRLAASNEVATYSNGSLASLRIINANRSPKATVYVYMKFGIDVPYEKILIFKTAVEKFVKERPREWLQLGGIRAVTVEADLGYIKYVIVLQHVESWQNVGAILQSKADVSSFCLEVSKKLEMRFKAPPMPVDLKMVKEEEGLPMDIFPNENYDLHGDSIDVTNQPVDNQADPQPPLRFRNDSAGFSEISAYFKTKPSQKKK